MALAPFAARNIASTERLVMRPFVHEKSIRYAVSARISA